ncbi:hypothetical protein I316_06302 [Kwoniella heveanensis BCC8398]|uniref:Uncharacterized protein n=1 Tax=Kwoniella heveanensis BCC8398 TaxID=1296120 RepID=A0A1B9GMB0_9TREE|nr:hypothetical protein I316_06302 [Kwoniella heveanensis BCC8398]
MFLTVLLVASLLLQVSAWGADYKGALYTLSQTDDQAILVSALHQNGSAEFVAAIQTGGNGVGDTGPDSLYSSDSLVVHDNLLFAVNPASNDLSVFAINEKEPWYIEQVGNTTWSGGDFPTSLAVSPDGRKACVTNAGSRSNVRCFKINQGKLEIISSFEYDLTFNQTTPPVGPAKTPSDLSFTNDGQRLIVTVKGAANATQLPAGRIEVFKVSSDSVSHESTVYAASGPGGLPFSITPIANSAALLLTDPAVGAEIIPATCWGAYSAVTDQYFTVDLTAARIVPIAINSTSLEASVLPAYSASSITDNPAAPVDIRVVHFSDQQDYLYSLVAGDQTVRVFDLGSGPAGTLDLVQTFELGAAYNATGGGVGTSIEGLALFPRAGGAQAICAKVPASSDPTEGHLVWGLMATERIDTAAKMGDTATMDPRQRRKMKKREQRRKVPKEKEKARKKAQSKVLRVDNFKQPLPFPSPPFKLLLYPAVTDLPSTEATHEQATITQDIAARLRRLPIAGNLAIPNPAYSAEADADSDSGSEPDVEAVTHGPQGEADADPGSESDAESIGSVIVVTRATGNVVTTNPDEDVVATDPSDDVANHPSEDADPQNRAAPRYAAWRLSKVIKQQDQDELEAAVEDVRKIQEIYEGDD